MSINIGVFYHSLIAGCNCADDPTPVDKINEYLTLNIVIPLNHDEAYFG